MGPPGAMVLHRIVKLPVMALPKVEAAMHSETKQMLPGVQEEMVSAYHVVDPPADNGPPRTALDVVLLVAKRVRLALLQRVFQQAGLTVDAMQSDCLALHNFLAFEHLTHSPAAAPGDDSAPAGETVLAAIDVGGDATNVVISSPGAAWFHSVPLGSERFTRILAQEMSLSYGDAERLKAPPGRGAADGQAPGDARFRLCGPGRGGAAGVGRFFARSPGAAGAADPRPWRGLPAARPVALPAAR